MSEWQIPGGGYIDIDEEMQVPGLGYVMGTGAPAATHLKVAGVQDPAKVAGVADPEAAGGVHRA